MSLEAIQEVARVEQESRDKLSAADAEAKRLTSDAEEEGQALLRQIRAGAAEEGRNLMRQAEERAAKKAEAIAREARGESETLRKRAEMNLERAAEFIVGRVVKR